MDISELKQRWRRRRQQREGEKSKRFRFAKQQLCACITLFCTFLCRRCTTTTWKCLISRFVEDVNGRRLFFCFPELWYSLLEFNSRKICQHFMNWMSCNWDKRDKVWSSANSLFKWRFRNRRRYCCLSSLLASFFFRVFARLDFFSVQTIAKKKDLDQCSAILTSLLVKDPYFFSFHLLPPFIFFFLAALSQQRMGFLNMLGVYVVMGCGIVAAFITLIAEIYWKKMKERETKLSCFKGTRLSLLKSGQPGNLL